MNITGFYNPSTGSVDAIEFLSANILGICRDLKPELPVSVVHVTEEEILSISEDPWCLAFFYHHLDLDLEREGNQRIPLKRTFLLSREVLEKTNELALTLPDRSTILLEQQLITLSNIWTLVFRAVRTFLQVHFIPHDQWLSEDIFQKMLRKQSDLLLLWTIHSQALYDATTKKAKEKAERDIDAFLIALISASQITPEMMMGSLPLNFHEIFRAVQLRRSTITELDLSKPRWSK
jgi:hypothetical protein